MKSQSNKQLISLFSGAIMLVSGTVSGVAEASPNITVPVAMTVTANVAGNKHMPDMTANDIVVRQGKSRLEVTGWTPARGDNAGLELFILIDDAV